MLPSILKKEKSAAPSTRDFGAAIESQALETLQNKGLQLVTRNYLCKLGEIDLIMRDKKTLVFVEVRYRKNNTHGSGLESVNHNKQQKIIKTALHYLQRHKLLNKTSCRFDVISASPRNLIPTKPNKTNLTSKCTTTKKGDYNIPAELIWIKDAFQA